MDLSPVSENPRPDGWPGNQQSEHEGDEATRPPPRRHYIRRGPSSPHEKGHIIPPLSRFKDAGVPVGTEVPIGTEVGLGPGDIRT